MKCCNRCSFHWDDRQGEVNYSQLGGFDPAHSQFTTDNDHMNLWLRELCGISAGVDISTGIGNKHQRHHFLLLLITRPCIPVYFPFIPNQPRHPKSLPLSPSSIKLCLPIFPISTSHPKHTLPPSLLPTLNTILLVFHPIIPKHPQHPMRAQPLSRTIHGMVGPST